MKNIFIGMDGTFQDPFKEPFHSNVFRLGGAINFKSKNKDQQLFFYYPGVGTQTSNKWLSNWFQVTGEGLDFFILEAYVNLVLNYEPDDEIFIFGFSRGAVAARALTGLISCSGIVDINSPLLIKEAWENFINHSKSQNYLVESNGRVHWGENKKLVKFLGVWDCVPGPIGKDELLTKYRFKNRKLDKCVEHGVHIISIDETRSDFLPLLWDIPKKSNNPLQIWMPGVHCDVGGGYKEATLSNISFLAMLDILIEKCSNISIDEDFIETIIMKMCRHQSIVINDEWDEYLPELLGLHFYRNEQLLSYTDYFHPVVNLMHGSVCKIRNSNSIYDPFYKIKKEHINYTPNIRSFRNDSYWDKVKGYLAL